ncbi:DNA polymerase III subunit delta [Roseivirga sp. 4D4]|uniref:DNA polymerase III subunit n=1 Tax=Roseivirga sp. 4D4 TaxID=1889784 RepID=UPI000852A64C|nr:DNA polymerase III subunit delta [Roseivirga sp. 4D4]OEK02380.1 DNA polymerase III subunit delta [Roseivirga sp. 4D4]
MRFQDIPGLDSTKQKLVEAVASSHVAHAQLFAGTEGSANLAMALAFATYLNCENPSSTDSCGECSSCQKNAKFIHPDVNFIFPSAATTKLKREDATSEKFLNEWRVFLQDSVYGNVSDWSSHFGWENKLLMIPRQESRNIVKALSLKAFEGQFKVMIIWLPELMNTNAANGILKILEEPPEKTVFIMVSNDANKLLTTILSRTQQFRIPAFSDEEIKNAISSDGVSDERASQIAYMAEGSMRTALQMMDGEDNETQNYFKNWFRQCFTYNFTELISMADEFQKKGKDFQKELLGVGSSLMRESLIYTAQATEICRIPAEEEDFIQKFGKVFTPEKIMEVSPKLDEAQYHIERNANPKILFLDLSLTIAQIARA